MNRRRRERPKCPRWCDYSDARNHPTNHVAHVGDVVSSVYSPVKVIAITIEACDADPAPLPVLAMLRDDTGAACTMRLAWPEAEHVGRLLVDAHRRYAQ